MGNSVAGLLQQARKRAGLTQSELARLTGVAQPNISDYEGNRRSPTVRTMLALLEGCGAELALLPESSPPCGDPPGAANDSFAAPGRL